MKILNKLLSFIKPPILFLIDSTNFSINKSIYYFELQIYRWDHTNQFTLVWFLFINYSKWKKGSPMAAL